MKPKLVRRLPPYSSRGSTKDNLKASRASLFLQGNAATSGVGAGKAIVLGDHHPLHRAKGLRHSQPENEVQRFQVILEKAAQELHALEMMALKLGGSTIKEIVHTQSEILHDPVLVKSVTDRLKQHETLEQVIDVVFSEHIARMEETGNTQLLERTSDLRDIRDRLFRHLTLHNEPPRIGGSVLIANEITPTELLEYAPGIRGAAMSKGGATSHVAIIASALEIPLVMGVRELMRQVANGDEVIVDADHKRVILHPGTEEYQEISERASRVQGAGGVFTAPDAHELKPAVTPCGKEIPVRANIEFEPELDLLDRYAAEGIGLVRTESIWLRSVEAKTIERQRPYYEAIVRAAKGNPVTIRLLDIGGDKLLDRDTGETNPYLGWRGARLLLQHPEWIKTQLEAILEVSAAYPGVLRIMMPMVTEMDEWLYFKHLYEQVQIERRHKGLGMDERIPLGMMVEVPSVALRAGSFAKVCDFFSIGTNDLTQYILAVDRGNPLVSSMYDGLHPAVLDAIGLTVRAAEQHDIPVSVCGEAAAEPVSAACLIGLGVQELSMSPRSIPLIRGMIRRHTIEQFKAITTSFLGADQRSEREALIRHWAGRL